MTNVEAIEIIKCGDITNRWGKDGEEVEKMAIKALEQQTCEDAVSREAVLDIFADNADATRPYSTAWEKIRDLPPVNPQQKMGHWIFDEILDKHYYCSECKSMGVDYWDFCPNCGARMIEPQERSGKE